MTQRTTRRKDGASVDRAEVEKFAALSEAWWDPEGDFRPLHRLNPVRLAFIRDHCCAHFERDAGSQTPLSGLDILDVGCGGGLLSEPLARLGGRVTGIDAANDSVRAAAAHARQSDLAIDYRHATAESLAEEGRVYDVVLAMEVVEHVADVESFLATCGTLVKPGGVFVGATLNRTPKAFVFAILGAEYLLRWLPRGTHDWRRFLRPSELAAALRDNGLTVREIVGVTYNPLNDRWQRSADLDVNYMVFAVKP